MCWKWSSRESGQWKNIRDLLDSTFVFDVSETSRKYNTITMKILMRADTHVSFSVPAEDPVAKCTLSQVIRNMDKWYCYLQNILIVCCFFLHCLWIKGIGGPVSVVGIVSCGILVRLHITGSAIDEGSQHNWFSSLWFCGKWFLIVWMCVYSNSNQYAMCFYRALGWVALCHWLVWPAVFPVVHWSNIWVVKTLFCSPQYRSSSHGCWLLWQAMSLWFWPVVRSVASA